MKLLLVTQHFHPEDFRCNDVAFEMARRGVDVTVVTGIPNYPKGKFFPGYGLFRRRHETVNGVRIIRVPIIPRGHNKLQLAVNFLAYALNASVFMPFHLLRHKYDACLVHQTSPVTMALPGVVYTKITGKPLYTWVLDLWPDSLQSVGGVNNKTVLNFFDRITNCVYRNSNKILMSSRYFANSIISKGDYKDKLSYFPNWAEKCLNEDTKCDVPELPKGFRVVFAGNVGEAQDFPNVVEAMSLLPPGDDTRLIVVGDGRKLEWLRGEVERRKLKDKIVMVGRYPMECMPSFFRQADCMLATLKKADIFELTLPAKIPAYMQVGKPVLAMMGHGGVDIIREADCGIGVPPGDPQALADAILRFKAMSPEHRKRLGENGRAYAEHHFNRDKLMDQIHTLVTAGAWYS